MHHNVYTGVCLAVAMGVAAPAIAQTGHGAAKKPRPKTITAIGCLEGGDSANSFVLNVLDEGGALPAGSRVSLTTGDHSEAQAHIGQKVQVLGTILDARRSSGAPTPRRMYVRDIRQVAPQCAATAPGPAPSALMAMSGVVAGTPAPTPAAVSAETTTALSGKLAQTGVSGNATLTASPGSTMVAQPAETAATTQAMAPPATAVPAVTADPPPVAVTGDPAVAQQMSNKSTMIGTLEQTGVSGDALLTGLVSVNVQQVMAAVQAQANIPVQADVIVNVSDIANDLQVQALVQALNTNPQASMNANDLTSALQSAGLIDPNQFVVGVTGSEIYSNTDLTTKLQQRGIISPSETIMSMLPGRIYVAEP
jgi:hypothetical protein